jgi:hypothetical protein
MASNRPFHFSKLNEQLEKYKDELLIKSRELEKENISLDVQTCLKQRIKELKEKIIKCQAKIDEKNEIKEDN